MILVSEAVGAHSHLILRKGRRRTEDLEKVSVTGGNLEEELLLAWVLERGESSVG